MWRCWNTDGEIGNLAGVQKAGETSKTRKIHALRSKTTLTFGSFGGGISILFSDRAEARIKHDPPLQTSLQPPKFKYSEVVDRIYGLRQTDKFRLVLDSIDKRYIETRNIPLRESIKFSPLSSGGNEPLLFPFLIMEAKSSKGRSRSETHMQSAFCIRQLLEIQRDLVTAAEYELQDETDPLIWYIATRGEQWDIYAGFVEVDQDITRYVSFIQHQPPLIYRISQRRL